MRQLTPKARRRQHRKPNPYTWIHNPIDGLYALLAAVIEQARVDAALEPDTYQTEHNKEEAYYNQQTAIFFLNDLGISAEKRPPEQRSEPPTDSGTENFPTR